MNECNNVGNNITKGNNIDENKLFPLKTTDEFRNTLISIISGKKKDQRDRPDALSVYRSNPYP